MPESAAERINRILGEIAAIPAPACRNKVAPLAGQLRTALMEYSEAVQLKMGEYDNIVFQLSLRLLNDKKPN